MPMHRRLRLFLLGSLFTIAACTAQVTGALQVDHAFFALVPEKCRSGAAFNFSGIQLEDAQGRRLRLHALPSGDCVATLFAPESGHGVTIPGSCGPLLMHAQSSRINSILNVQGSATLSCEGAGHRISGSISFKNCH